MNIKILNHAKLQGVPSGSGIIKSDQGYYVIGDDSPYLFMLDKSLNVVSKIPLIDSGSFPDERIIKSEKPDFEALEMIGNNEIVVFGSGSKSPVRNIFLLILLNDSPIIERYDISGFYGILKSLPIFADSELNIEAAAYRDGYIFLFNRNKNLIIKLLYSDLLAFLKDEITLPTPEIIQFTLPKINGIESGFSGATTLK